jgi:hypothetical protein
MPHARVEPVKVVQRWVPTMTSVKQVLQELFPGDQLTTLLGMIGVFAMIIFVGAMRAKFWQDRGDSAVFLAKQRFQSLFGRKDSDDGPN